MLSFLLSEVAFFSTLIVAYVTFKGEDTSGPTPAKCCRCPGDRHDALACLASSLTVHLATHAWHTGEAGLFSVWWAATIALGIVFLAGTAYEWHGLIVHDRPDDQPQPVRHDVLYAGRFSRPSRDGGRDRDVDRPGAAHCDGRSGRQHAMAPRMVSWYWHFVDVVWIVVFAVVYL